MKGKKVEQANIEYESVKIKKSIVNMLRENKKKTLVPISGFIETLVLEKLQKDKK